MPAPSSQDDFLQADRMLLEAVCAVVVRTATPSQVELLSALVSAELSSKIEIGDDVDAQMRTRTRRLALGRIAAFLVAPDPSPVEPGSKP
jgi:hypothetical protein